MRFCGSVKDKSGAPLCDVPVSDGRNIVCTDADGRFCLDGWERCHTIHVGILTKGHSDWFYVTDGHEGEFDFVVEPVSEEGDFSFFHVSDTEIEGREKVGWVDFMREKVSAHKPVFFIHTGDLCRKRGVERHLHVMNFETVGCPVRYVIGNHDFIGDAYGEERYERLYGPCWYSFDVGDVHFVALSKGKGDNPSGYLPEDQLIWLENDLATNQKGKKLIIFDHDLCKNDETGFTFGSGDRVFDLRARELIGWIFGHYHINYAHEYGGVLNICSSLPDSGGIDSSAGGIRKLTVKGGELSTEMIYNCPAPVEADDCEWSTQLDGHIEFSTPLVIGDSLFAATCDDGYPKSCGIYRLDKNSGNVIWKYAVADGIKGDMTYDGGRLYAQDTKGRVYCFDGESGKLLWQKRIGMSLPDYTRSGVVVADELLICGSPTCVHALNKRNGETVFAGEKVYSENTPARFIYDKEKGQIIVSAHWNGLYSIDVKSGKTLWKNFGNKPIWYRSATPLVLGDRIYTVGERSIAEVDADTGEMLRIGNVGADTAVSGAPVSVGDFFYLPTVTDGVLMLSRETFEVIGRMDTLPSVIFTSPYAYGEIRTVEGSPVVLGELIVFIGNDGYLRICRSADGVETKKIYLGAPSTVSPVVQGNAVYTADFFGRIAKFIL